jgi:glyoxylase-like metal-dependent hydrolase (beta-lactamase superfamily II)
VITDGLELHVVSDGQVYVDAGGAFGLIPRALFSRYMQPDVQNRVPMTLNSLIVRSRGKTILVDTGLGNRLTDVEKARWGVERPEGGLLEALGKLSIRPEDIDIVVNTHLHADHCGGNTRHDGSELKATFPAATYLVQRIEWAEAVNPDARTRGTYFGENYVPLLECGQLELLHGDCLLTDQVRLVVTPGHTRGHQSVVLEAGNWRGLFLGDMASYAAHFERVGWVTAYDVLPLETIATKERWHAWALSQQAWLFFPHDPMIPIGRLEASEDAPLVIAVGESEIRSNSPIR